MNGEPVKPILLSGAEGRMKQNSWQIDGSINDILFTKPLCETYIAPNIMSLGYK
jgi:hypothetical protein